MPGPIIRKPAPLDIPNLASKLPEPFRKPAAMLGSLASEFLPAADDVTSQVMPSPLVSLYKDPARRAVYTEKFREAAKKLYPEHVWSRVDKLVDKFPRVAAHTRLSGSKVTPAGVTEWQKPMPNWDTNPNQLLPDDGGRFRVLLNSDLAQQAATPDILAHEMGHVAQRLGNKEAPKLYNLAMAGLKEATGSRLRGGADSPAAEAHAYINNPFETSARTIALRNRFAGGKTKKAASQSALHHLNLWAEDLPDSPEFQEIAEIMRRRSGQ